MGAGSSRSTRIVCASMIVKISAAPYDTPQAVSLANRVQSHHCRFTSLKVTHARGRPKIRVRNPFRLAPALKFGAIFTAGALVWWMAGM